MDDIIPKLRLLFFIFGVCTTISAYPTLFLFVQFHPLKDRIISFCFVILGPVSILMTANESSSFLFYLQWISLIILCIIGMLSCLFRQNILTGFITVISTLIWFAYGLGLYFIKV
jgi:hypothetical protein